MIDLYSSQKLKEAWEEWLQYRKERKLPKYTPTGLKKTYTHLLNISESDEQKAIEIINQSIAQNWAGLFPIKKSIHAKPNLREDVQREFNRRFGNGQ